MARTITLGDLKSSARELADVRGESGEGFVENPDLTAMANKSLGLWWGMVIKAEPERFEETVAITITGAASYDLPEDSLGDLAVEYVYGNERRDIPRLMLKERHDYGHAVGGATYGIPCGYRVASDQLFLYPPPDVAGSGSYNLVYVPCAPVLVDDTDSFDGVNGWESWITYDMAIQMRIKEEASTTDLREERAELEKLIRSAARRRSLANPARIVDVGPKSRTYRLDRWRWAF